MNNFKGVDYTPLCSHLQYLIMLLMYMPVHRKYRSVEMDDIFFLWHNLLWIAKHSTQKTFSKHCLEGELIFWISCYPHFTASFEVGIIQWFNLNYLPWTISLLCNFGNDPVLLLVAGSEQHGWVECYYVSWVSW